MESTQRKVVDQTRNDVCHDMKPLLCAEAKQKRQFAMVGRRGWMVIPGIVSGSQLVVHCFAIGQAPF